MSSQGGFRGFRSGVWAVRHTVADARIGEATKQLALSLDRLAASLRRSGWLVLNDHDVPSGASHPECDRGSVEGVVAGNGDLRRRHDGTR